MYPVERACPELAPGTRSARCAFSSAIINRTFTFRFPRGSTELAPFPPSAGGPTREMDNNLASLPPETLHLILEVKREERRKAEEERRKAEEDRRRVEAELELRRLEIHGSSFDGAPPMRSTEGGRIVVHRGRGKSTAAPPCRRPAGSPSTAASPRPQFASPSTGAGLSPQPSSHSVGGGRRSATPTSRSPTPEYGAGQEEALLLPARRESINNWAVTTRLPLAPQAGLSPRLQPGRQSTLVRTAHSFALHPPLLCSALRPCSALLRTRPSLAPSATVSAHSKTCASRSRLE